MAPTQTVPANEVALRTNLALIQGLLARARSVEIQLNGKSSAVVRHAKRKGLICVVTQGAKDGETILSLSGPYSLFRGTLLYGRALGELVPVLAWCNDFELIGEIILAEKCLELKVRSGDPIFPSEPPRPFDSKLEEHFCRALLRATKQWDLIREPAPVSAAGTLIFPDFALQHRGDPTRRWLLEIVGYWTPDYLRTKLERLRQAKIPNLLLCVSDKLNCADRDLPAEASVIRFSKRIDAKDVLNLIDK
jgi:predicted nuclease of restriction endonuclease-like RecB superfamily